MTLKTKSTSPMAQLLEEREGLLKIYQSGEIVAGVVTAVTKNRIWVDIDDGRYIGVISNKELMEEGIAAPTYHIDDPVTASVLIPENDEGFMILSLRDALQNQGWQALDERKDKDEVFEVKVMEANRGGLIVEADGLRGFLPVSQLAPEHYPRVGNDKDEILSRLEKLVGTNMAVKVLDLDKNVNKLIFSEKIARRNEFEELVAGIKVGDVLEGSVSGVVDFGIFVTIGKLEGLVHISEISWDKVEHPSKFAKVGDKVKVQVIGIDEDKISLSMKRLTDDPWLDVIKGFAIGSEVNAEVTQIMPFGVFVRVNGTTDGLIHISELSHDHVTDPSTIVKAGDKFKAKIIDLGAESHRLGLSLKALQTPVAGAGEASAVPAAKAAAKSETAPESDLAALGLSDAIIKKLATAGITNSSQLQGKSVEDLSNLPGIGSATAEKIVASMTK